MEKDLLSKFASLLLAVMALVVIVVAALVFPQSKVEHSAIQSQTVVIDGREVQKININIASKKQLMLLEGVGEITAQRIIDGRPYKTPWELVDIEGISSETARRLLYIVTV